MITVNYENVVYEMNYSRAIKLLKSQGLDKEIKLNFWNKMGIVGSSQKKKIAAKLPEALRSICLRARNAEASDSKAFKGIHIRLANGKVTVVYEIAIQIWMDQQAIIK
jgi:hypothetical protein